MGAWIAVVSMENSIPNILKRALTEALRRNSHTLGGTGPKVFMFGHLFARLHGFFGQAFQNHRQFLACRGRDNRAPELRIERVSGYARAAHILLRR